MSEFDEKLKNYVIRKLSDKSHRGYYEDIDYIMDELIEDIYGTKFIDRVCETGNKNDEEFQWFVDAVIEKFEYDDDLPGEEGFVDDFFYEDPNAPEDEELMSDPEARSAYEKALQETGKKYDGIDAVYKSKTHVVREAFEDFIFHDLCGNVNVNVKKSNLNKKGGNMMSLRKEIRNDMADILEAGGYFDKLIEAISEIEIDDPERIEEAYRGGKRSKEFESLYGDVLLYMENTHYPERAAEEYYDEMSDEEYGRLLRSKEVNAKIRQLNDCDSEDVAYNAVMDYLKDILHEVLRDVTWEYVKKVARGVM